MNPRQLDLLRYHADLAAFATSPSAPVFVIADLEDADGLEIASRFQPNAVERRDAIRASGEIPAYTFCLSIEAANRLIASGWPQLRRIETPSPGFFPLLLFSGGTCLSVLLPTSFV